MVTSEYFMQIPWDKIYKVMLPVQVIKKREIK